MDADTGPVRDGERTGGHGGGSAVHMRISQRIGNRLRIEWRDAKEAVLAEGRRKLVPCAGPSELPCRDRVGFAGALVMGDESLSGVIPTEGKADRKI